MQEMLQDPRSSDTVLGLLPSHFLLILELSPQIGTLTCGVRRRHDHMVHTIYGHTTFRWIYNTWRAGSNI